MPRYLRIFILLANCCELVLSIYTPPQAKVEPLYPKGFRISIPDERGISLVAFHVKFNEEFDGIEAGTIARDILRVRNGRWTYEDRTTELKFGDKVHYWVHVVYDGLGYNLLFQEHEVTAFYNYDGTRADVGNVEEPRPLTGNDGCELSQTVIVDPSTGERIRACSRELLLSDEFDARYLNKSVWKVVEQFSPSPDYPFVMYRDDPRSVKVESGTLRLMPTLLQHEYGKDFIRRGSLTLPKCTGQAGTPDCTREAKGRYILPPVASGAIYTKESLVFSYGRIEVRAQLPKGDWIYPIIALKPFEDSVDNAQQLRIVESLGNENLQTSGGTDISGHVLCGGPLTRISPENAAVTGSPRRFSSSLWSNDYHTYELLWRRDQISVKVDNVEYGSVNTDSTFDKPFYITLSVGVGGHTEFPDQCKSGVYPVYVKPWRNVGSQAMFDFFNSTDVWSHTWSREGKDLKVDYVKVWAL